MKIKKVKFTNWEFALQVVLDPKPKILLKTDPNPIYFSPNPKYSNPNSKWKRKKLSVFLYNYEKVVYYCVANINCMYEILYKNERVCTHLNSFFFFFFSWNIFKTFFCKSFTTPKESTLNPKPVKKISVNLTRTVSQVRVKSRCRTK